MLSKTCEICSKMFSVPNYRPKARFCSQSCGGKWHMKNRVMRGPDIRGNTYRKGLRPTNAFTSEQVRGSNNPKWVESETFTCEKCGDTFGRKPWLVRQNGLPRFCSRKCFVSSDVFSGDKSSCYVGDPVTYRGRGWLKRRAEAVSRDLGVCQRCDKFVGDSVSVHHIVPYREFKISTDANELSNLICLCQSCHMIVEPRKLKESA